MTSESKIANADTDAVASAYADVAATPPGAAMIADLMQRFQGNPFDATSERVTSYRCGQLSVVGHILEQAEAGQRAQQGQTRQETANG